MKREIKFRAIVPVNSDLPKHIEYFDLSKIDDSIRLSDADFDIDQLMQYTGFKDKNGKEIYEGDLIDYGNGRFKPVEFIDGCFCICKITSMPKLMTLFPIIGNIYENPELLNNQ